MNSQRKYAIIMDARSA